MNQDEQYPKQSLQMQHNIKEAKIQMLKPEEGLLLLMT